MNDAIAKVALIGGDERQLRLAAHLARRFECSVYALPGEIGDAVRCADWKDALSGADAVLLPLPATRDGETVCAPLFRGGIPTLRGLIGALPQGTLVCGGMLPEDFCREASEAGLRLRDYGKSEVFLTRNAVPTAEGALEILLGALDVTVAGSAMLVVGYGRVGQATARLLAAVGARVTVAARSSAALALAASVGCDILDLKRESVEAELARRAFTAVINTVPAPIFDSGRLAALPEGTPLVELASIPCANAGEAKTAGIRYIPALSLPGKTAPQTAAAILAETVDTILEEEKL